MSSNPTTDVYLSYALPDAELANKLAARLRALGLSVWLDQDSLAVGKNWVSAMHDAIQASRVFAVVASRSAESSNAVNAEIAYALAANSARGFPRIIPLRTEDTIENFPFLNQFVHASVVNSRAIEDAALQIRDAIGESDGGLLPPADMLAEYDQIVPGVAERLIELLESEQLHRLQVKQKVSLFKKLSVTLSTSVITATVALLVSLNNLSHIGFSTPLSLIAIATLAASIASVAASFFWDWHSQARSEEGPHD